MCQPGLHFGDSKISDGRIQILKEKTCYVADDPILEEQSEDPQFSRWLKQCFEKVTGHVGRVYLCDTSNPIQVLTPTGVERCVGTVGLMDDCGASLCALHTIYDYVEDPSRYKIHVVYPNYHQGRLAFEARVKSMDEDVDICVLEPAEALTKPWTPLTCLELATDTRKGDSVYCFFYAKDPSKHQTPELFEKMMKPEKPARIWRAPMSSCASADHPTIIPGNVCLAEWMQGVATYSHLPDADGGLLVSRSGRVKGMHVKALTCGELQSFLQSGNPEEERIAKELNKAMSTYAPSESLPVFVPPHGLVRMLQLQGGSKLLQAALLQNKVQMTGGEKGNSHKVSKRKRPSNFTRRSIHEKKPKR